MQNKYYSSLVQGAQAININKVNDGSQSDVVIVGEVKLRVRLNRMLD